MPREGALQLYRYWHLLLERAQLLERVEMAESTLGNPVGTPCILWTKEPLGNVLTRDAQRDPFLGRQEESQKARQLYLGKLQEIAGELEAFEGLLSCLEPLEWTVIRYCYLDGLSQTEVARKIHYSRSAVCTIHATALEKQTGQL